MDIKLAEKNDISGVATLFREIVEKLDYYTDKAIRNEITKYTESELLNKVKEDRYSLIIAKKESEIVGFCFNRMDDTLIWLEWFGVSEKVRKEGVAKKIVAFLKSTLKYRDAHKIWCDCRTDNVKSANLLTSCGYLPICTVKNHWYGQDFILWQKEFNNLT